MFLFLGMFAAVGSYYFGRYMHGEENTNDDHPKCFGDKMMNLVTANATCMAEKESFENSSFECKTELATCKCDLNAAKERETKVTVDHASCKASMDARKTDESSSKENYCNEMSLNLEKDNVACHTDLKHIKEKSDKCEAKYCKIEEGRDSFRDKVGELNNDLTECRVKCKAEIENESDKRGKEWKEESQKWRKRYEDCVRTRDSQDKCQKDLEDCQKTIRKSWF